MAKLDSIKKAKRGKKPFGTPAAEDNGRFEILIPPGAETGVIPDGDKYIGKLSRAGQNVSKKGKGNPQWYFTFSLVTPKAYKGMEFTQYCPLVPNSLWKLTDTCTALGVKTARRPDGSLKVDFHRDDVLNTLVRLSLKKQAGTDGFRDESKIVAVLPHPDGAGKKAKGGFIAEVEEPEEEEQDEEMEDEETTDTDEEEDEDVEDSEEEESDEDEGESEEDEDDEGDEDEEESEDEEDEDDEEGEWDTAGEAEAFSKKAGRGGKGSQRSTGRPKLTKDDEYADVKPVRRRGPKVEEKPVKRAGRPAGRKKAARR